MTTTTPPTRLDAALRRCEQLDQLDPTGADPHWSHARAAAAAELGAALAVLAGPAESGQCRRAAAALAQLAATRGGEWTGERATAVGAVPAALAALVLDDGAAADGTSL